MWKATAGPGDATPAPVKDKPHAFRRLGTDKADRRLHAPSSIQNGGAHMQVPRIRVFGARDSKVYAQNAADGSLKWSFAAGADVDASGVFADGREYVPSKDRRLDALNLTESKLLWTFETARPVSAQVAMGGVCW